MLDYACIAADATRLPLGEAGFVPLRGSGAGGAAQGGPRLSTNLGAKDSTPEINTSTNRRGIHSCEFWCVMFCPDDPLSSQGAGDMGSARPSPADAPGKGAGRKRPTTTRFCRGDVDSGRGVRAPRIARRKVDTNQ